MPVMNIINPKLKDIWQVALVVQCTLGFIFGILQYITYVFYYDKWGESGTALSLVVVLLIFIRIFKVILEVPTGALADYLGRKKTVVFAFMFRSVSSFILTWIFFVDSISITFTLALAAAFISSFAQTLYSGSFNAWIVDSVRERDIKEGHGAILAKAYSPFIVAKVIGAAIGISLYLYHRVYFAFALVCFSSIVCAAYCAVIMNETKDLAFYDGKLSFKAATDRMKDIIINGYQITIQAKGVFYNIIFFSFTMAVMLIVLFFWAIAMKTNFGIEKMTIYWYIVVFFSFISSYMGSKFITYLNKRYLVKSGGAIPNTKLWFWMVGTTLIMACSLIALGCITYMGYRSIVLFITVIAIINIGYGFLPPAYNTLINNYIPEKHSKERATIMSFQAMLTNMMLMIIVFPSSGNIGNNTIIAWIVPGICLMVITIIVHILMRRYQKSIGELPSENWQGVSP